MGSLSVEVRTEVLCGRICDLEAENVKLREELESVGTAAYLYGRSDLKAENAKLRELVRDMVLNMGGCALHGNPLRLREFMARARELGIEEDDG